MNIVYQIQRYFGCSSARAMELTYNMIREEQCLFNTSSFQLMESYQQANHCKQYVKGLHDWIMGNMMAYLHYPRYAEPNKAAAQIAPS